VLLVAALLAAEEDAAEGEDDVLAVLHAVRIAARVAHMITMTIRCILGEPLSFHR
jgi:hypothetical protein